MQLTPSTLIPIATIAGLLGIAACSSSSSFEVSSGGFAGSGGVGGVSSTGSSPPNGGPVEQSPCPAEAPDGGSALYCSEEPAGGCAYGPDIRRKCNDTYDCVDSRWELTTPECASDCPKSFGEVPQGAACPDSKVACSYEEGTCGCVGDGVTPTPLPDAGPSDAGADGGEGGVYKPPPTPGTWKCVAPPTTAGCPNVRPRETDPCVKPVTCDYGSCALGQPIIYSCTQGRWFKGTQSPADCP